MEQKKLGNLLLNERRKKLTQFQLAQKLGVSNKVISKWECGREVPEITMLIPLSEELEVSVKELLIGGKDEKRIVISKRFVHGI